MPTQPSPWETAKTHLLLACSMVGFGLIGSDGWGIAAYVVAGGFLASSILLGANCRCLPDRCRRVLLRLALPNLRIFLALASLGLGLVVKGGFGFLVAAYCVFGAGYGILLFDMLRAAYRPRVGGQDES